MNHTEKNNHTGLENAEDKFIYKIKNWLDHTSYKIPILLSESSVIMTKAFPFLAVSEDKSSIYIGFQKEHICMISQYLLQKYNMESAMAQYNGFLRKKEGKKP